MEDDVKKLRRMFSASGIKKGDLVVTGEIYRVLGPFKPSRSGYRDFKGSRTEFRAVRVWPECEVCAPHGVECLHRCIKYAGGGQQGIVKLRMKEKRNVRCTSSRRG